MPVVQPGETTHSKPVPMYQPPTRVCASSCNIVAPAAPAATCAADPAARVRSAKSRPALAYPPVMYGIQRPNDQPARPPMVTMSLSLAVQLAVCGTPGSSAGTGLKQASEFP